MRNRPDGLGAPLGSKRADVSLVERGFFESRAKARAAIEAGLVKAAGRLVRKASEPISDDASVEASPAHPWVGRGALKLDYALSLWDVPVTGRIVLDIGASTGGFTEVCLTRGARRVYAVDVGRGQLHPRLAADPRVVSLEATDARSLDARLIPEQPDLIISDVSFISLTKALPAALGLGVADCDLIVLVKPQFEVGPEHVGRGGRVRDPAAHDLAREKVCAFLEGAGWSVAALVESPVPGGEGALEHLLHARRRR